MQFSWIEPGFLAASGIPVSEKDVRALRAAGIGAILSLTGWPLTVFPEISAALFAELDLKYFHVPVRDQHPPTHDRAQQILSIINDMAAEKRAILVHCHAGVGRTGTILHLYYLARGLTLEEAKAKVSMQRIQCTALSDSQLRFLHEFAAEVGGQ